MKLRKPSTALTLAAVGAASLLFAACFDDGADLVADGAPQASRQVAEQAFPGETGPVEKTVIQTPEGPRQLTYTLLDGKKIVEGDIILPDTHDKAAVIVGHRWPGGRVPYEIDANLPNKQRIVDAIDHYNRFTPIRLVPRNGDSDYVRFVPSTGCSSSVGRNGNGRQDINLATGCGTGETIHEIGHAVGLWHEQSRADRDNFVTVNWGNIEAGQEHNFNKYSSGYDFGGYDLNSIMHYGSYFFSKNGQPTIVRKDGSIITPNTSALSAGDRAALRQMYTGWSTFQMNGGGSAAGTTRIAAVSRIPNSMEVFWIAPNGAVMDTYWYDGSPWRQFELAPAGSASVDGGIVALSRVSNSMEVFWIAPNGSVQDAYWYEGGNWNRFELAGAGSASINGGITGVSRIPNSMEVFWVAPNGAVRDAYWYEGGNWNGFELAPAGSASVDGGITVTSRIRNSMEVFWVGPYGSVEDAFWYEGGYWNRFQLEPNGSVSTRSGIKALSRIGDSMELWYARSDGSVGDSYWYPPQ